MAKIRNILKHFGVVNYLIDSVLSAVPLLGYTLVINLRYIITLK